MPTLQRAHRSSARLGNSSRPQAPGTRPLLLSFRPAPLVEGHLEMATNTRLPPLPTTESPRDIRLSTLTAGTRYFQPLEYLVVFGFCFFPRVFFPCEYTCLGLRVLRGGDCDKRRLGRERNQDNDAFNGAALLDMGSFYLSKSTNGDKEKRGNI